MKKKYFYVDNLHEYGKRLYYKKRPKDWKFIKLSKQVYCLYSEKTKKIVMSKKHPKDKPDIYIAFAICYHKYMGLPEPKERTHVEEKNSWSIRNWRKILFTRIAKTRTKMLWLVRKWDNLI